MAQERRTRQWWQATVERWRRSGLSARAFGEREGIRGGTLLWWSSELGRARRGDGEEVESKPIEIAIASPRSVGASCPIEIEVSDVVVRCEAGTDVGYVAALIGALGSR